MNSDWLLVGGIAYYGGGSLSQPIMHAINAERKREQLNRIRYAAYEILKARGDPSRPLNSLTVKTIIHRDSTSIEFDLSNHLRENHFRQLVELPIGKGPMKFRIAYAIDKGRSEPLEEVEPQP